MIFTHSLDETSSTSGTTSEHAADGTAGHRETPNEETSSAPRSKLSRLFRVGGWVGAGFFFLLIFTWMKLPDDRMKNYLEGMISNQLGQFGITYTVKESSLSFWLGPSYTAKDVTLNFPPPAPPSHIDQIEVAPSILGLLIGKTGGKFWITQGEGKLKGSVSIKNTAFNVSLKSTQFDFGKLGILPALANIQASGLLDSSVSLSGDFNNPSLLDGSAEIRLSKGVFEAQTIAGFSIPKLALSEGVFEFASTDGKAVLKTLRLGKMDQTTDDIRGTLTGEIGLGKSWPASTLNLKTRFSVSENVMIAFILLDALLGAGKQPDGSYSFALTGTVAEPNPAPVSP